MLEKVSSLIGEKPFYIPFILLKNYKKLNITDSELIVLIYLINDSSCFNPKQLAKDLDLELADAMNLINALMEKGLLKIEILNKKIREEIVNLDELYNRLGFLLTAPKEEEKNDIYNIFEKEFGRTLSPLEYEAIANWQKEFDDDLIVLALKEAVYNGVNNLRYIDKIIYSWNKKGIKTEADVLNEKKQFKNKKSNKELFYYDWLNEKDN